MANEFAVGGPSLDKCFSAHPLMACYPRLCLGSDQPQGTCRYRVPVLHRMALVDRHDWLRYSLPSYPAIPPGILSWARQRMSDRLPGALAKGTLT